MNNILRIVHETPYSMSLTIILLAVMTILPVRKLPNIQFSSKIKKRLLGS